jgi:hypothetical protein
MMQLLAGLFLAPAVSAINMETNYALVPYACQSGKWWLLSVTSLVALVIALYGSWIAWHNWRAAGAEWPSEEGGMLHRTRFVGVLGLGFSLTGCALILMQLIPVYLMDPCVGPR